jgi:hypothetical protein
MRKPYTSFIIIFCKVHKTLRVTPAMEAKLTTKPMTIENIVEIAYAHEIEAVILEFILMN